MTVPKKIVPIDASSCSLSAFASPPPAIQSTAKNLTSSSRVWRVSSARVVGSGIEIGTGNETVNVTVGKGNVRMNVTIGIVSLIAIAARRTENATWSGSARELANGKESEKGIGIESSIGTKVNSTLYFLIVSVMYYIRLSQTSIPSNIILRTRLTSYSRLLLNSICHRVLAVLLISTNHT